MNLYLSLAAEHAWIAVCIACGDHRHASIMHQRMVVVIADQLTRLDHKHTRNSGAEPTDWLDSFGLRITIWRVAIQHGAHPHRIILPLRIAGDADGVQHMRHGNGNPLC